jgi:hypothetical protein
MPVPTEVNFRLVWTRTADGVVVLRYHEDWAIAGDPTELLWSGAAAEPVQGPLTLLLDLRNVPCHVSMRALGDFMRGLPELMHRLPQRRAYLVGDTAQVGLARMIQSRAEPLHFETECFVEWDAAMDWLQQAN